MELADGGSSFCRSLHRSLRRAADPAITRKTFLAREFLDGTITAHLLGRVEARMQATILLLCFSFTISAAQERPELEIERRIVEYLKEHVKPGERVVVSDLHNNVFKTPEERKVLERMFNTFFKIPLFVAQYKAATNDIPTLADIARQFNLPVEGEAAVLLSIMESDPRVPRFITRDPASGEITAVDIEAVKKDRRFGQVLERTLTGWPGRDVPPFTLELIDGSTLSSSDLGGRSYLLYFWFTGCPPCVRIAPHLAELQRRFGSRDFTVVAVNADRLLELDVTDDQRSAYAKKAGFTFPVAHMNRRIQEDFGAIGVYPTLFLIDAAGVIRKHYVNYQPLEVLSRDVEDILR
ncbi:MAG: redoxin family protein [Acidobacteria bacterium]|nr:redoxin family protein [Acidobacteriota bacterium]